MLQCSLVVGLHVHADGHVGVHNGPLPVRKSEVTAPSEPAVLIVCHFVAPLQQQVPRLFLQ